MQQPRRSSRRALDATNFAWMIASTIIKHANMRIAVAWDVVAILGRHIDPVVDVLHSIGR